MVNTEYSTDNYKSLRITTGTIIKNPKMISFVPDHFKAKRMCTNAIKKLPFLIIVS